MRCQSILCSVGMEETAYRNSRKIYCCFFITCDTPGEIKFRFIQRKKFDT